MEFPKTVSKKLGMDVILDKGEGDWDLRISKVRMSHLQEEKFTQ